MIHFLHTGDWHVGKTLRGRSRADEHRAVLQEIASIAREREVDFVLVAGDLFDTAAPSPESEEIVYRALLRFVETGATVVLIAGNHDSPRRIAAIRPLLDLTRIHSLPEPRRPSEGGVLELRARSGETARIALLPFLSQRGIVRADDLMRADADEHAGAYAERAERIVATLCSGAPATAVNVLLAHAMVHGGALGGGERSAHTVFQYSVPTSAFPPSLHYVALGHLHRAQALPGACPIRYSGSPLQLDFSETEDTKSVTLVDATSGVPPRIEEVPLRSSRRLRTLRATLSEIEATRGRYPDDLLQILVDAPPHPGLADEVREAFPNAVDVRLVRKEPDAPGDGNGAREGKSPQELFAMYLEERGQSDAGVEGLFSELLSVVLEPDAAA